MNLRTSARRSPRLPLAALAVIGLLAAAPARAAIITYVGTLSGVAESPPNASPGTGSTTVTVDDVALTMRVQANFSGLIGTTTAAHIHGPTAVAGTGTAGVMTTTPTFAGFPGGVSSGSYDNTLDLTQASSFNPSFVSAQGGVANARATLLSALAAGKAYLNIHSNAFPGGEIRAFLIDAATPAEPMSWGRLRALYR